MAKMIINGEVYSGSTNYASAITYIKEDGTKSTVQKELDYRPVNNNLLINSNFANPVNQRGVTAETWIPNRYGIDRWITDMTFSSITNGLTIGSLGTTGFLSQRFEEGLVEHGKKYSFSICIDGVIYNGTNTTDNSKGMVFVNNDIIKAYIDYSTDNDYWYLGLEFKTVGVTIEWAKLELGEVATPYVPRLYNEELELCKRYYQKIGGLSLVAGFLRICPLESKSKTQKFGMFLLEKEMRIRPTVYFNRNSMDIWVTAGNVALTIPFNTIDIVALDTKSVHVEISHNSHDYVAGGYLNFKNQNDYIAMDAEL